MELQQLRCLVAVLETGSFTKAAAALQVTQGAVSHAVGALERELGLALVIRGRGDAVATDAGQRLSAHANVVLARLRAARQEVQELRGLHAGTLRVGSFSSASAHLLPALLARYHRLYPGVEVSLREGNDIETREWLLSGVTDVSFAILPDVSVDSVPLGEDALALVLPRVHRLAPLRFVELGQLATESVILSAGGCADLVRNSFRHAGVVLREASLTLAGATAIAMVGAGLGLTLMPRLAIPPLPAALTTRQVRPAVSRRIGLAMRVDEQASPAAAAFRALALTSANDFTAAHGEGSPDVPSAVAVRAVRVGRRQRRT